MNISYTVSSIPYINNLLSEILLLTKFVNDETEETKKWLLETDFRTFKVDDLYEKHIIQIAEQFNESIEKAEDTFCSFATSGSLADIYKKMFKFPKDLNVDELKHVYYMDSKASTYRYIPNMSYKFFKDQSWFKSKYYDQVITNLKKSLNTIRHYNEVVSEFKEFHPNSVYLHQIVESWATEV